MERVGNEIDAAARWQERAKSYADHIDDAYHRHRLDVIRALLPDLRGRSVIDFGCGEGILAAEAFDRGATSLIGIDINDTLLDLARKRLPAVDWQNGGVERLSAIPSGSIDCMIAANVLAYLSHDDDRRFYEETSRILRSGGSLVVTHSNALFDLFTLNAYTVAFFRDEFGCDPSPLLRHPDRPQRTSFNVRENPLAYPAKLDRFGFCLERIEYMNYHHLPPLLSGDDPDDMDRERPDTLAMPEAERWKLAFKCSMFGVRATHG
jgi:ubiquinone/menaquinone biosynthesis C-methylase UbiE